MWNWLMVRPERMILTIGAVLLMVEAAVFLHLLELPTPPSIAGSEPYTAEVHELWQANCESLGQPGRQCGD